MMLTYLLSVPLAFRDVNKQSINQICKTQMVGHLKRRTITQTDRQMNRGVKLSFMSLSTEFQSFPYNVRMIMNCIVLLFYVHGKHLRSCWDGG